MQYNYTKKLDLSFSEALEKTKVELGKEGFGVLTEIDVKATLKNKLDKDFDNYVIYGVCNPSLAYEALLAQKDIGLFLPCNVIVYEEDGKSIVSVMLPTVALQAVSNPAVNEIAKTAEEKLKRVIENI
ncbi:MAG: DUF302 domain-containing protein [Patescibacteria group bacterium]